MPDVISGAIKLSGLMEGKCFTSWQEFVQALPSMLTIEVPSSISNVTVGNIQPAADELDHLWIRKDSSGSFVGLYVFSLGKWRQVYPVDGEVIWMNGDSRLIPDGYVLIDTGTSGFTQDVINHIKNMYKLDNTGVYYVYFAVTYVGF